MGNIPLKVSQHVLAHHFPHKWRIAELLRLGKEEPHPAVAAELERATQERHVVITKGLEQHVDTLLAAYMECCEYRGVYSAGQLMLCNLHVLMCCHRRLKSYLQQLDQVQFEIPWLDAVKKELSVREKRMEQDIRRADVFQSIGRTNEFSSLVAEKFNAVIRDFDCLFPNKPRVSRNLDRLNELIEAMEFFSVCFKLIEAEDAINRGVAKDEILLQKEEAIAAINKAGRSLPFCMLDRKDAGADKLLDSDYNSRNIKTAAEMLQLFQKAAAEIQESQKDNHFVIEGGLASSVNAVLAEVDLYDDPPHVGSSDITKQALNIIVLWREFTRQMQSGAAFSPATEERAGTSWAITTSHAVFLSSVAWAARVRTTYSTYSTVRRVRSLKEILTP